MNLHGFKLRREEAIKELRLTAQQYEHVKTGAQLLYLPADDDNKAFCISFNTHSDNSTGVAHILEHSVLNGSKKYPVKEPFLNMIQSSLSTFLNAITSEDTTMYPVASQNEKDFHNLMDVYLDAVFHPNIYLDSLTFRQEGWHLELDEQKKPYFTGVVYSEMKGAMSSPHEILEEELNSLLYDNIYKHNYGGAPKHIVELTYTDFLKFHNKHYHPSNAHILLYGEVNLSKCLEQIDSYLAEYKQAKPVPRVPLSRKLTEPRYSLKYYPSEDPTKHAMLKYIFGDSRNLKEVYSLEILSRALFNFESSPVKRELVDSGLCSDISAKVDASCSNISVSVNLQGVNAVGAKDVEKALLKALENAAENNLHDVLDAALNKLSFSKREGDSGWAPKGIIHAFTMLYWDEKDYDFNLLRYEDILAELKTEIASGALQELVKSTFLNNPHRAIVLLEADPELAKRAAEEEAQAAKEYWQQMSDKERRRNYQLNEELKIRQTTPDSPEKLACLPKLSPQDLLQGKEFRDVKVEDFSGSKFLYYEADSSGIMYFNLIFPVPQIEEQGNFILGLLSTALGDVDTSKQDYQSLNKQVLRKIGSLSFYDNSFKGRQYLFVAVKALPEQLSDALSLSAEILNESIFTDLERLKNIISMEKTGMQQSIIAAGNSFAQDEVFARFNEDAKARYEAKGLAYYNFLNLLLQEPERLEEIAAEMAKLLKLIVNKESLMLSFIGNEALKNDFTAELADVLDTFKEESAERYTYLMEGYEPLKPLHRAYKIPSQVQFVAMGGRFAEEGSKFDGRNYVFAQILNSDYLWNRVRVQGGAYGCGASITRSGLFGISSFRDPNCGNTLTVYQAIPEVFRRMNFTDQEIFDFIVGTIAQFDHPHSVSVEGDQSIGRYLRDIKAEDLAEERKAILNTKASDLAYFADLAEQAWNDRAICVLGSEAVLEENSKLFEEIKSI